MSYLMYHIKYVTKLWRIALYTTSLDSYTQLLLDTHGYLQDFSCKHNKLPLQTLILFCVASQGRQNKVLHTQWLKTTKIYSPQFWRLEV